MSIEPPTCDIDGCDTEVAGLEDGYEVDRGLVCIDCMDYRETHLHWPDQDPEDSVRIGASRCYECEASKE